MIPWTACWATFLGYIFLPPIVTEDFETSTSLSMPLTKLCSCSWRCMPVSGSSSSMAFASSLKLPFFIAFPDSNSNFSCKVISFGFSSLTFLYASFQKSRGSAFVWRASRCGSSGVSLDWVDVVAAGGCCASSTPVPFELYSLVSGGFFLAAQQLVEGVQQLKKDLVQAQEHYHHLCFWVFWECPKRNFCKSRAVALSLVFSLSMNFFFPP